MNIFFITLCLLFLNSSPSQAQGHSYECRKSKNHVIHIVTLQPQKFAIAFIKAHNQVFGRETIESIAKRTGADIAINAGFFEIGDARDGMPSGTLIINKQLLGLNLNKHACLIFDQKSFKIQEIAPRLEFKIGQNTLVPKTVNKLPNKDDIILYSHLWGSRTLTPLKERQEIALNGNYKVVEFSNQGNIAIPKDGFVLSLPIHHTLNPINRGDEATIVLDPFDLSKAEKESAVMGIPILIQAGKINHGMLNNKENFYQSPHARTAFGMRTNGDLILVVAEHFYKKPLQQVTLDEVKSVITNNKAKILLNYKKSSLNELTVPEMKEIVAKEYGAKGAAVGLTLPELANLMKDLGCESAINLDGGGSSSLFMNGQVINRTVGDKEESMGRETVRPISDAIVFKTTSD